MIKFNQKKIQKVSGYFSITLAVFGVTMLLGCTNSGNKTMTMKEDTSADSIALETYQELGFFGKIKDDKWDDFVEAVRNNVTHSRREPGNLAFHLYESEDEPQKAFWFERFETKDDHNLHKEQDYFHNAIKVIQESLESEANSIYLKELKEMPIMKTVETESQEPTRNVFVLFDVKPEKREAFIQAMKAVTQPTRKAKGNLEFNLYEYTDEANHFALIEAWESKEDHLNHLKSDHSKKLEQSLENLFVSNPMDTRWIAKDISNKKN